MYRHGFPAGLAVGAPDLVHQLDAGKNLPRIGQQLVKQQELLLGQLLGFAVPGNCQRIIVKNHIPDLDPVLIGDLCPAQQGPDAQKHLLLVDGLGHIVVRAHQKSLLFISRQLLGRYHQNRKIVVAFPENLRKFIPVHLRHHHIQHHQVHMGPVHHGQGIFPIFRRADRIVFRFQHRF